MRKTKAAILFFGIGLLAVSAYYVMVNTNEHISTSVSSIFSEGGDGEFQESASTQSFKELAGIEGYLNTEDGLTLESLVGEKVIIVDFWTYSCINCQRTLPYVTAWYEKYRDQGLEIVGVHTPEFDFEKEIENVQQAVDKWGIEYPVVLDNDYATWQEYKNRYWPRKYIIDIHGNIVYDHIGEGAYEETERVIQGLLKERAEVLGKVDGVSKGVTMPEDREEVDVSKRRSPETYFGTLRQRNYGGKLVERNGDVFSFEAPEEYQANVLYLVGDWKLTGEYAEAVSEEAKIVFRYQAEKVFLVASSESEVEVGVSRAGQFVGKHAGEHISENGTLFVKEEQLYRIVEEQGGNTQQLLELFVEPGLRAYAFTFG